MTKQKGKKKQQPIPDRVINSVTKPIAHELNENELFEPSGKIRMENLKTHFILEGRLSKNAAFRIIRETTELLRALPNVLTVNSPLTIVGDIHGQFYDLMKVFEVGGKPENNQFLFLGDYVDRGCFGIECVLYLFCFKIIHKDKFQMLRGNHECRHLTKYFSFRRECEMKYSYELYAACMEAFDCLPLVAIIDKKFICLHGGLSPEVHTINDIKELNRFREPPSSGPICDLLWSDPVEDYDTGDSKEFFKHNSARGCSYSFSFAACSKFLKTNGFLSVIRAHEAQNEGFRMYKQAKKSKFPSLITIFSAPNYLDVYENKGAVLRYENNKMNIRQYNCAPHPYWLPNFLNVFTWSLPFIAEKSTQILVAILNICSIEELNEQENDEELRQKIHLFAKAANAFTELREENEFVLALKGLTPANMNPLSFKGNKVKKSEMPQDNKIHNFDEAKKFDKINEMMPN